MVFHSSDGRPYRSLPIRSCRYFLGSYAAPTTGAAVRRLHQLGVSACGQGANGSQWRNAEADVPIIWRSSRKTSSFKRLSVFQAPQPTKTKTPPRHETGFLCSGHGQRLVATFSPGWCPAWRPARAPAAYGSGRQYEPMRVAAQLRHPSLDRVAASIGSARPISLALIMYAMLRGAPCSKPEIAWPSSCPR